jgi:hypothetical protein
MRLYRLELSNESRAEVSVSDIRWVGTQGQVSTARKDMMATYNVRRSEIEVEEIDVPTSKAELLEWLNKYRV